MSGQMILHKRSLIRSLNRQGEANRDEIACISKTDSLIGAQPPRNHSKTDPRPLSERTPEPFAGRTHVPVVMRAHWQLLFSTYQPELRPHLDRDDRRSIHCFLAE